MDYDTFCKSVSAAAPPKELNLALQALWWDAKGNWEKAHAIADKRHDANGSWVHAYLHRKEGDRGNAGYWYRHAGKTMPGKTSLADEWAEITQALIDS